MHGFASKWNCPQSVGTLDSKYVQILELDNNCSMYYIYNWTFNILLFALVVNAHYNAI